MTDPETFTALARKHGVWTGRLGITLYEPQLVVEGVTFDLRALHAAWTAPFAAIYEAAAQ